MSNKTKLNSKGFPAFELSLLRDGTFREDVPSIELIRRELEHYVKERMADELPAKMRGLPLLFQIVNYPSIPFADKKDTDLVSYYIEMKLHAGYYTNVVIDDHDLTIDIAPNVAFPFRGMSEDGYNAYQEKGASKVMFIDKGKVVSGCDYHLSPAVNVLEITKTAANVALEQLAQSMIDDFEVPSRISLNRKFVGESEIVRAVETKVGSNVIIYSLEFVDSAPTDEDLDEVFTKKGWKRASVSRAGNAVAVQLVKEGADGPLTVEGGKGKAIKVRGARWRQSDANIREFESNVRAAKEAADQLQAAKKSKTRNKRSSKSETMAVGDLVAAKTAKVEKAEDGTAGSN